MSQQFLPPSSYPWFGHCTHSEAIRWGLHCVTCPGEWERNNIKHKNWLLVLTNLSWLGLSLVHLGLQRRLILCFLFWPDSSQEWSQCGHWPDGSMMNVSTLQCITSCHSTLLNLKDDNVVNVILLLADIPFSSFQECRTLNFHVFNPYRVISNSVVY